MSLLAVSSAVAMALLFTPPGDATRVYYGTDTHSFGLALGVAVAIAIEGRMPARWLSRTLALIGAVAAGALVALALAMAPDDPFVTRGGLALVAALTALAIAGAISPGSWLGRGLDVAPLRWVGERSYGLVSLALARAGAVRGGAARGCAVVGGTLCSARRHGRRIVGLGTVGWSCRCDSTAFGGLWHPSPAGAGELSLVPSPWLSSGLSC